MREEFHGDLRRLGDLLAGMSETAARQMKLATSALLDGDLGAGEQVLAEDAALDADRDRCEENAQRLLALQAPVAGDLRTVITAMHCAERIERMGDLARHVAELARRAHPEPVVPEPLRDRFAEFGRLVTEMAGTLTELVRTADCGAYERMHTADERVDAAYEQLMRDVSSDTWPYGVQSAVNVTLLGRFYERFADQVVSVTRRLDYAVAGVVPR
ncbi:MAG TPA: PhoU domain-containing protein [Pseudonocardiaceae bacterium]|jgi:phosphate transport system protein|nr:PhoU domain-containing protein [Pseudonocardiaceae bacterium]